MGCPSWTKKFTHNQIICLFSKRGVSERAYTVLKSKQFHLKRLQFISLENGVSTAETLADLPCIS